MTTKIDLNMPETPNDCAAYSCDLLDALEPMTFNEDMTYSDRICRILMMRHMAKAVLEIGWFEHTGDFDPFWEIRRVDDDGKEFTIEPCDASLCTIHLEGFIDDETMDGDEPPVANLIAYCDDEAETPVSIPIDKITYMCYGR